MVWGEKRVEDVSRAYCNSQDGDEWDKQPAYYRKQIRRMVRAVLALAEDADRLDTAQESRWAEYVAKRGEQTTLCHECGNLNLAHDKAVWTDDGSSFCPRCAP